MLINKNYIISIMTNLTKYIILIMVAIVQLVEHQIVALDVEGSNPSGHPLWMGMPSGEGGGL